MDTFSTTFLELLDDVVQQGRGVAASILGQNFYQFRQTVGTNGNVFNSTPIDVAFEAKLKRTVKRDIVEGSPFEIEVFIATASNETLALGDILLARGYGGDTSAYCYMQGRPMRENLFVRCEQMANITFPFNAATQSQPALATTTIASDLFGAPVQGQSSPLVYRNGLYGFGAPGDTAAIIPVGISLLNRVRPSHDAGLPDAIDRANYVFYVPPLNPSAPIYLKENTEISTFLDGNAYRVLSVYQTRNGAVGSFGVAERIDA